MTSVHCEECNHVVCESLLCDAWNSAPNSGPSPVREKQSTGPVIRLITALLSQHPLVSHLSMVLFRMPGTGCSAACEPRPSLPCCCLLASAALSQSLSTAEPMPGVPSANALNRTVFKPRVCALHAMARQQAATVAGLFFGTSEVHGMKLTRSNSDSVNQLLARQPSVRLCAQYVASC